MAKTDQKALVRTLLQDYGRTVADELGIAVARNTPAPLFQLLVASLLLSARISADNALQAARALRKAGFTTPQKMAGATWQQRVDVITWHGYKRYDESTSTMLGDTAQYLLDTYRGDLRRLRQAAGEDARHEKKLLTEFKGIGSTGADIFLREIQGVWPEAYPYADPRVLKAARRLKLGGSPQKLAEHVPRRDFARFSAALLRVDLADAYDQVRQAA